VRLASAQPGDILLVSKGGRRFHAHLVEIRRGVVRFEPIERGISSRHGSAREVLKLWHSQRARRGSEPEEPDLEPLAVSKAQLSTAGRLERPSARRG
jgi:hypothetical protein